MPMKPSISVEWGSFPKNWSKLSEVEKTENAGLLIQEITRSVKVAVEGGQIETAPLSTGNCFERYKMMFRRHLKQTAC